MVHFGPRPLREETDAYAGFTLEVFSGWAEVAQIPMVLACNDEAQVARGATIAGTSLLRAIHISLGTMSDDDPQNFPSPGSARRTFFGGKTPCDDPRVFHAFAPEPTHILRAGKSAEARLRATGLKIKSPVKRCCASHRRSGLPLTGSVNWNTLYPLARYRRFEPASGLSLIFEVTLVTPSLSSATPIASAI